MFIVCRYYYKRNISPKNNTVNYSQPEERTKFNIKDLSNKDRIIMDNITNDLLANKKSNLQGKTEFTKQEITKIEHLLTNLRLANPSQQKRIRQQLRNLGFYISDYGFGITSETLHLMITMGKIKITQKDNVKSSSKSIVQENKKRNVVQKETSCKSFKPIVFNDSHILILGTMPGRASLKAGEYYASSSNSFWKIIELVYNDGNKFANYEEKIACLKKYHIALWDVYKQCDRPGSLDSSINNETLNDIDSFLSKYKNIKKIIFNGKKASLAYSPQINYSILCSTSNSNSHLSFIDKVEEWRNNLKD